MIAALGRIWTAINTPDPAPDPVQAAGWHAYEIGMHETMCPYPDAERAGRWLAGYHLAQSAGMTW